MSAALRPFLAELDILAGLSRVSPGPTHRPGPRAAATRREDLAPLRAADASCGVEAAQ